ncbi:hypothetical protein PORCRE_1873 [Porphyromonas crevioricanis JCM 15906]|uniref:Uncharacterized protein n=2 Tax=Porphyromonas crevioricanis TaxID=393921 RepID=A0A2X4PHT7_9PORP|nr:hypothetical protein PORCRE_1873 [Porphyromonas crevioricanis JCM 15906]GAD06932.1 hypothetical protein PORCAN_541 [Porphyromonas crevioricanis JCM 13913]SJZ72185.1 hypothetical protein SAMN02745203_00659 [Porphyromonas crevioricanis]SQH73534.1 Uncharacterised protein [Porphyromonas crevioricanis]
MNAEERDFLMMRKEISQTVFCKCVGVSIDWVIYLRFVTFVLL